MHSNGGVYKLSRDDYIKAYQHEAVVLVTPQAYAVGYLGLQAESAMDADRRVVE